jgi:hypothetical protein
LPDRQLNLPVVPEQFKLPLSQHLLFCPKGLE